MMNVVCVPQPELLTWLKEEPPVGRLLETAYRACIPSLLSDYKFDPRFLKNDHLVNPGFTQQPMFVMGIERGNPQTPFNIGVLYVFPDFRNRGLGQYLIQAVQNQVGGLVQVAVAEKDLGRLQSFYEKLGFCSLLRMERDDLGDAYCDFFWAPWEIELTPNPVGGTFIKRK